MMESNPLENRVVIVDKLLRELAYVRYGTYIGRKVNPTTNGLEPIIKLDNGENVWAKELWWGLEYTMNMILRNYRFKQVA